MNGDDRDRDSNRSELADRRLRLVPDPVPDTGEAWPGGPKLKQTKTGTLTEWACRLCQRVYPNEVKSYTIDVNDHEWALVSCESCLPTAWRQLAEYANERARETE